ncbi:MAG: T9SS type A sorting domain-containing protein [Ignavibacteriaceae bacterium]|jgi:hypothetical protein|nr:T9SS type A sorting domain-containing protein [Ignavibacteriaceae bacterium]
MVNKFLTIGFIAVFILLISSLSPSQTDSLILFVDDFESLTAGQQLVCQDSINWDTWNSVPCDTIEDPYVTNITAYSGENSVWIQQNNDLVKPVPDYTSGKYSIRFQLYIPADFTASWGQLAAFINPDSTEWAFYTRFNPLGNGTINAGGWDAAQFSFSYDTWVHNELIVDLNTDWAEYYFDGNMIHGWQWTLGADGDTVSLQLSVTDLWGGIFPNTGPTQYYIDDYVIERLDTVVGINDYSVPTKYILNQNYPNPFNPSTTISYSVPELSFVTIKVYDVLGNEIASLVNEEKPVGNYEIEFNASLLPSGVYFYRLLVIDPESSSGQGFVETKKMILLK